MTEGADRMGRLWGMLQRHIDEAPYPPSERQIARKLGVSPTTLANWRDPKQLPSRENLQAIADLIGARYATVLDAALHDTGYHEAGEYGAALRIAERRVRVAEENLRDLDERIARGLMDDDEETREFRQRRFVAPLEQARAELEALQPPGTTNGVGA